MVEKIINPMKKLILEFFKDSKIEDKDGVLSITSVPEEFETFLGEKAPYLLVFDYDTHEKVHNSELIMPGSYFLFAIRDFMRNRGLTTHYTLSVPYEKIDIKKIFKFGNCTLKEIKEEESSDTLTKFTFLSICQYLNKKKQIMHELLIKDGSPVTIDLSEMRSDKRASLSGYEVQRDYIQAKQLVKNSVERETEEIRQFQKEKLERELERVKKFYFEQIKERDDELERVVEKIKMLEAKLKHTYYDRDAFILKRMIRESTTALEKLKKQGYRERLKEEEAFHIQDEVEKHVVSVDTHMVNCSIIEYPIQHYRLSLQVGKDPQLKTIVVSYDSLFKRVAKLRCSNCKNELDTISIGKSGSVNCASCLKK